MPLLPSWQKSTSAQSGQRRLQNELAWGWCDTGRDQHGLAVAKNRDAQHSSKEKSGILDTLAPAQFMNDSPTKHPLPSKKLWISRRTK